MGALAVARVAIGVAFIRPAARGTGGAAPTPGDTLMRRSFAIREFVLGVGGLLAVAGAGRRPSNVRLWAGLGTLTDSGDLWAALAGHREEGWSAHVPALAATAGLACELWALRAAAPH